MSVTVRRATAADVPEILRLVIALAAYEREPDAVRATAESLHETMFAADAQVFAHVAVLDGVIGVALWFPTYSTWTGRPSLYLEDLFVDAAARGTGAGKALLRTLAREAVDRGCARMDWAVLDWNETAAGFYERMGAHRSTGWQPWRVEGDALAALADAAAS